MLRHWLEVCHRVVLLLLLLLLLVLLLRLVLLMLPWLLERGLRGLLLEVLVLLLLLKVAGLRCNLLILAGIGMAEGRCRGWPKR